eukprot:CAMPEP_0178974034 /NCGR_PEP_ID=MMETSP0789-20121207/22172_1 /TAXON_ID=3005 /ORGANISM="Rhizosolenia setigera, Strain CCMP 1694" /LENGTH=237 /DNA_ID=CAMNT_0020662203 /DNA_START=43 /DNA_END=756 /DNA_ORIENTATION=+
MRRSRVLLGASGSVAVVKVPEIAVKLHRDLEADVRIVLTHGAQYFWGEKTKEYDEYHWIELQKRMAPLSEESETDRRILVYDAQDEWKQWKRLGDPVLHIDLRNWADVCLLAPLSAHTLAKIANGLCDDPLSSCLRAWDYGHVLSRPPKPLIIAPAMNTAMWLHPLTQKQIETIQSFWCTSNNIIIENLDCGVNVVEPQTKTLACGEIGHGALACVDDIVHSVEICLKKWTVPIKKS